MKNTESYPAPQEHPILTDQFIAGDSMMPRGEQVPYPEQRTVIEDCVARHLARQRDSRPDLIETDPTTGAEKFSLRVPVQGKKGALDAESLVLEDGTRTTIITFTAPKMWGSTWQMVEKPGAAPRLTRGKVDEGGEYVEQPASEHYDPQTDYEIAFWGRQIARDIMLGEPKKVPALRARGILGKLGLR